MALIKWYDVSADGDCLEDAATWNDMIDYIKHSACTDFTIYSTCPDTGQAFRFTQNSTISKIYGGANDGDTLYISANDFNTRPRICMFGNSDIWLDTADEIKFKQNNSEFLNFDKAGTYDIIEGKTAGNDLKIVGVEGIHNYFKAGEEFKLFDGATEAFRFSLTGVNSYFEGGFNAGDKLRLKGTSVDILPQIVLQGGFHIEYNVQANKKHMFQMGSTTFVELYETGTDDIIEGKTAGNDLYLKPVGLLKWGTEQTNAGSDRGELIPMKTAAGTTVYLKTYDLA